jgi:hypothetical protein
MSWQFVPLTEIIAIRPGIRIIEIPEPSMAAPRLFPSLFLFP